MIKSYTDLQQSRKLAEILPLESADMCYTLEDFVDEDTGDVFSIEKISFGHPSNTEIGCWSLAALLGVMPDEFQDNHYLTLEKEGDEYCCCYEDTNGNSFKHTFADNPVDACYEMIIKLHELKKL